MAAKWLCNQCTKWLLRQYHAVATMTLSNREDAVMSTYGFFRIALLLSGLAIASQPLPGLAQQAPMDNRPQASATRDGQHDFDWEIGTWKTHLKRRLRPLTGSNEWVEYD